MAYLGLDAAFHYQLADAFTVCDAYHCSFIGNTDPNRYLWSGWTGNDGKGGGPVLYNDELGYDWTTYPERLEQAEVSWKVYQDEGNGLDAAGSWGWTEDAYIGNYGDNSLLYFNRYRNARRTLYEKARQHQRPHRRRLLPDPARGRAGGPAALRLLHRRAGGRSPARELADRLRRVVHRQGPRQPHQQPRGVEQDGPCSSPMTRTTASSTTSMPPLPACPVIAGESTVSTEHSEFYPGKPGDAGYAPGPFGAAPRVPMFVVSPWAPAAAGSARKPSTTPRSSATWSAASGCASRRSRRGVEQSFGDLTNAFDFNKVPAKAPRMMTVDAFAPKDRLRHPELQAGPARGGHDAAPGARDAPGPSDRLRPASTSSRPRMP